jgi:hypothetical protein
MWNTTFVLVQFSPQIEYFVCNCDCNVGLLSVGPDSSVVLALSSGFLHPKRNDCYTENVVFVFSIIRNVLWRAYDNECSKIKT